MRSNWLVVVSLVAGCGGSVQESSGEGGSAGEDGTGGFAASGAGGSGGGGTAGATPGTGGFAGTGPAGAAGVGGTPPGCPDPGDPSVHYASTDPVECAAVTFACAPGQTAFSNECGCGCIDVAQPFPGCPDPADPTVHYVGDSFANPSICEVIDFGCDPAQIAFSNAACGCGCLDVPPAACAELTELACLAEPACAVDYAAFCDCGCPAIGYEMAWCDGCGDGCFAFEGCTPSAKVMCPRPDDPRVRYLSHDPTQCATTQWDDGCGQWEQAFDTLCGCGCFDIGLD